jgi:hypothetical protein
LQSKNGDPSGSPFCVFATFLQRVTLDRVASVGEHNLALDDLFSTTQREARQAIHKAKEKHELPSLQKRSPRPRRAQQKLLKPFRNLKPQVKLKKSSTPSAMHCYHLSGRILTTLTPR